MMKQRTFMGVLIFLSLAGLLVLGYYFWAHGECYLWGQSLWCRVELGIFAAVLVVAILVKKYLK